MHSKILIAEDDGIMLDIIAHSLQNKGYQIHTATNGKEAIDCFLDIQPDLVILDAVMPVMDGFDACQQLKSSPEGKDIPIIMATSLDDAESVERAFKAGADDYITKPINWTILQHRTKHLLEAKQAKDALLFAQAERQASHDRLELIFSNIHTPVAYLDSHFNFIKVNQAYADSATRPIEYFSGKNHFELYPNPENERIFLQTLRSNNPYFSHATPFANADRPELGVTYWDWHLQPLKDEWGENEGLILSLNEVTHRVQTEQQIRISEQNVRALLDAPSGLAMLMTLEGVIEAINNNAAKYLGGEPSTIIGKNHFELLPEGPSRHRRKAIARVIKRGKHSHYEEQWRGAYFRIDIYPIIDDDGNVVRLAVYIEDITENLRAESIELLRTEINQKILDGSSLVSIFEPICTRLISLFDLQLAWIGEKRKGGDIRIISMKGDALAYGKELKKIGVRWDDTPLGQGPAGMAIRNNEISMVKTHDLSFSTWREASLANKLLSSIAIPLSLHHEVYGAITLYSSNPVAFDDTKVIKHLNEISGQIQIVLDAADSQEQLGLLSTALENAGNAVFITNQDGLIKWVNDAFTTLTGYSADESIGQSPHILSSGEQGIQYYIELWKRLLSGERWSSEIVNRKKDGSLYIAQQTITSIYDEHGDIQSFIAIQEDISDKREAEERIKHLALHDPLTDLPNRSLFNDRLDQAIHNADRNRTKVGLMFIDLNLFKQVNDTYGHNAGDDLLKMVSERLLKLIRASDTLARIGGDEFTLIVNSVAEPHDLKLIANKIIAVIEKPFEVLGHKVEIGCSIGGAIYPTNAADNESLLKKADSAMYRAKKSSTDNYYFTEE